VVESKKKERSGAKLARSEVENVFIVEMEGDTAVSIGSQY